MTNKIVALLAPFALISNVAISAELERYYKATSIDGCVLTVTASELLDGSIKYSKNSKQKIAKFYGIEHYKINLKNISFIKINKFELVKDKDDVTATKKPDPIKVEISVDDRIIRIDPTRQYSHLAILEKYYDCSI